MSDNQTIQKSDRDEHGRFKKGHRVPSPRTGRRKKDDYPLLQAITSMAYTPEQLVDLIHETVELARKQDDWKGVFQVVQFITYYSIGKPVQRSITASVNPDDLKRLFGGGDDSGQETTDDDESEVVEGEVRVVE